MPGITGTISPEYPLKQILKNHFSFNRTIKELKHSLRVMLRARRASFNRTIKELKR